MAFHHIGEWRPNSGTGWEYYDNYCILVRLIMIFIYYGQAPCPQYREGDIRSFVLEVVNKETDLLPQLRTAAWQGIPVQ